MCFFLEHFREVLVSNQQGARLKAGGEQGKSALCKSPGQKRPETPASHPPRAQVVHSLTLTLTLTLMESLCSPGLSQRT